jgi:hypothetical protein
MQLVQSMRRDGVMRKGEWRHLTLPITKLRSALVCCPKCGKLSSLSGYTIDPDGTVTPQFECPFDLCDFIDFVKLADWKA